RAGNWSQFLGRLQHRARQNGASHRPVLILIHRCRWPSQSPSSDVAVTSLSWDDALSKDDLISFSHSLLMRRKISGILRQVLVRTLAEISLTDIDLMKSLAGEALDEIAWPFVSLRNWAEQQGFGQTDALPRIYI